jgi:hypothetical protein
MSKLADALAKSQNRPVVRNGIGVAGATFLLLLAFKLGGWSTIPLSWFWVFFPLWGPLAIFLGLILAVYILAVVFALLIGAIKSLVTLYRARRFVKALDEAIKKNKETTEQKK